MEQFFFFFLREAPGKKPLEVLIVPRVGDGTPFPEPAAEAMRRKGSYLSPLPPGNDEYLSFLDTFGMERVRGKSRVKNTLSAGSPRAKVPSLRRSGCAGKAVFLIAAIVGAPALFEPKHTRES